MSKRAPLRFLQTAWVALGLALFLQSAAIAWLGTPAQVAAWTVLLPILSGIDLAMGAAAGGGPLLSDKIKASAGTLGKEQGG